VSSAANFVWADAPLDILGSVTSISFTDPADLPIKDHDLTTEEVFFRYIQWYLIFIVARGSNNYYCC